MNISAPTVSLNVNVNTSALGAQFSKLISLHDAYHWRQILQWRELWHQQSG